jgi:hypothetical protein
MNGLKRQVAQARLRSFSLVRDLHHKVAHDLVRCADPELTRTCKQSLLLSWMHLTLLPNLQEEIPDINSRPLWTNSGAGTPSSCQTSKSPRWSGSTAARAEGRGGSTTRQLRSCSGSAITASACIFSTCATFAAGSFPSLARSSPPRPAPVAVGVGISVGPCLTPAGTRRVDISRRFTTGTGNPRCAWPSSTCESLRTLVLRTNNGPSVPTVCLLVGRLGHYVVHSFSQPCGARFAVPLPRWPTGRQPQQSESR